MSGLAGDVRFAIRGLWKRPGFTLVVAFVLALGMGTATAMFSLVDVLLLKPLPVESPRRLVRFYTNSSAGLRFFTLSYPDYRDIAALEEVFVGVAAHEPVPLAAQMDGRPERRYAYLVTENYFHVLGLRPARGRLFDAQDGPRVAVLGAHVWYRDFGGSAHVIGARIVLNGEPFTIVAVTPESFRGTHTGLRPDFWIPLSAGELLSMPSRIENRHSRGYFAIGRLRDGVTFEEARARVALLAENLESTYPDSNRGVTFAVLPESEGRMHPLVRGYVVGLSAIAALVVAVLLLLACANVAGLLMARSSARRREICVRIAIGAGRLRILRQLLVESSLLALLGAALGVGLAWPMVGLVSALELPTERPLAITPGIDHRVLLFCLAILVLVTLAAGLVPALRASQSDPMAAVRDTSGPSQQRLGHLLVAGQVALSVVLVLTASLFLQSLSNAGDVDLGFQPDRLVMASIDLNLHRYGAAQAARFFEELGERLSEQPSIESVARASSVPLSLNIVRTTVSRESPDAMSALNRLSVDVTSVDEHYFRTMGIPLLRGRAFEGDDLEGNTRAAVVNDALADRLWPGERAVNQRIFLGAGKPREVVGVVKTGKYLSLGEEPKPFLYVPLSTTRNRASTIIVKAGLDVSAPVALSTLTNEILELDPELTIYDAKTMEEHLSLSFLPARASATIAGFFGAAALVLVAAGLYGVLAQGVTERTREIGIRRALGAETADVLSLFLRQGLAMVLSGLAFGLPAAIALGTVSRSVLHGAVASDPKTWGLAIVLLLAASALACWLPVRRAARVPPGEVLRYE